MLPQNSDNSINVVNVPYAKASVIDTAYTSGNVLGSSINSTRNPSKLRIQIQVSAAVIAKIVGISTTQGMLNGGTALTADAIYAFDVMVRSTDNINITFSAACTIRQLRID